MRPFATAARVGDLDLDLDQLVPFQRSAIIAGSPFWLMPPTAVQAVRDGHDTPSRVFVAPVGLGVGWIDHLLPFQRSANVGPTAYPKAYPTAVQALGDGHDTPPGTRSSRRWVWGSVG